jgi:23S rRNA (adenine2503-C2)-methyltransferase
MMPKKNKKLPEFINDWMDVKNEFYRGDAGLQLSINSTNEKERKIMFANNACSLEKISDIMQDIKPLGRKITLNFAVANYTVNAAKLAKLFNPKYFIIKLTPMHKTKTAINNKIKTAGDYTKPEPYIELRNNLQKEGFDVLVFIASEDEDLGRITCGNAILAGTMPECNYKELPCK